MSIWNIVKADQKDFEVSDEDAWFDVCGIYDDADPVCESIEQDEQRRLVREAVQRSARQVWANRPAYWTKDRQEMVVRVLGLDGKEGCSCATVAKAKGLGSAETVRQVKLSFLKEMEDALRNEHLEDML